VSFVWPWLFALLPLPWLARRWLPPAAPRVALQVPALADFDSVPTPSPSGTGAAPTGLPLRVAVAIWLLLVVAAARPVWIGDPAERPVSGRDLMIALDVSASMATPDLQLDGRTIDRLQVARRLAAGFVARRDGDRVGLIVFGNQAFLHTPLTYDLAAVRSALAGAAVGLAGRETALGDAVALAARRLREFGDNERVLILLTDGANTAGELTPAQAAWIAAREGLRIHAVGLGAERMRVVAPDGVREIDPSADLDEDALRSLAQQTGGQYHRATDGASLEAFYRLVDGLEPVARGTESLRSAIELYVCPLAAALALAAWLVWRRSRGGRR
jgi:Ca-activated chloride channel homolog